MTRAVEARLVSELSRILGDAQVTLQPVSGGAISRTAAVLIGDSSRPIAFVKWSDAETGHLPGLFTAEADGLTRLRDARAALRVPTVLACREDEQSEMPPYLLLEFIESAPPPDPHTFAARFGASLARMHRENSAPENRFGLERDNYIGLLPQANQPRTGKWWEFYRDRRIAPLMEMARKRGLLPPQREHLLRGILDRMETLLGDLPDPPTLIHGDLWSGNFLCAAGDSLPVLFDPSVYYAPREMELAYIELFGGFPPGFAEAYRAEYPLDDGYPFRRALHQLYPLLSHLNHFGEQYGPRVEQVCRQY